VSADGDVENSDMSYMASVPSGGTLTLPDSQINVNGIDEGNVVSVKLIDVNINDGVDIVVPTSVGLVANTLTITIPGGEVDVEINGAPYDTVTAPSTLDIPVINSAATPVGTINVLDVEIGDSSVTITDSAATLLHTVAVVAEGTNSQVISDATVENSDASYSVNVLAEGSLVLPDVTIEILDQFDVVIDTDVIPSVKDHLVDVFQYCPVADVENSDSSYATTVVSGGTLVLPDTQINVNSVDEGDVVSVKTIDVNLEDSVGDPVTPTSVGLVGNTLTIEVPSGGSTMAADFTSDKIIAEPFESIVFTDTTSDTPTNWSWGFGDNTNSILQNPNKSYKVGGVYNVSLLAGKIDSGDFISKTSYLTINNTYFTDLFGTPASAFSLRKLSPNTLYSGAAIRVRRSSDNTEQDINFASSGANALIDTSALLSFVGANNGFIVTWYNQNGSSNHATNSTASEQPRIVNAGVIEMENGYPCIFFSGTNQLNLSLISSSTEVTIISLCKHTTLNTTLKTIVAVGLNNGYALTTTTKYNLFYRNVGDLFTTNDAISSQSIIVAYTKSSTNHQIYSNNILFQNTTPPAMITPTTSSRIGAYDTATSRFIGNQQEIILFASDQLSNRTLIQNNINDYYNVF